SSLSLFLRNFVLKNLTQPVIMEVLPRRMTTQKPLHERRKMVAIAVGSSTVRCEARCLHMSLLPWVSTRQKAQGMAALMLSGVREVVESNCRKTVAKNTTSEIITMTTAIPLHWRDTTLRI